MGLLIVATAILVLGHVVPSAPGPRAWLIGRLGRATFLAAHSALSLAAVGFVVWAYLRTAPSVWLFDPIPGAPLATLLLMPIAVFLIAGRLTTRPADQPRGIYRICAVPGSAGALLWAVLHLVNRGEARMAVIFTGFSAICLWALIKNWRTASEPARQAGLMPFSGMLRGRQRLSWSEIGWPRLLLALVAYAGLLLLHPIVIGVDPLAAVF